MFKEQLCTQFARIGKALASPARLELLDLLAQGERPVEGLAREAGLSVANASAHLQGLRCAYLITGRKEGRHVYYRLADPTAYRLWSALRQVGGRQLPEIDRLVTTYLHGRQELEAISRDELVRRLSEGTVEVLNARPAIEYGQGHIRGALSLPVSDLEARLHELATAQEVVAYCRGPYCIFADEAVTILRAHGFRARRYEEGYPDWVAAGLPVARVDQAIGA